MAGSEAFPLLNRLRRRVADAQGRVAFTRKCVTDQIEGIKSWEVDGTEVGKKD